MTSLNLLDLINSKILNQDSHQNISNPTVINQSIDKESQSDSKERPQKNETRNWQ